MTVTYIVLGVVAVVFVALVIYAEHADCQDAIARANASNGAFCAQPQESVD